MKSDDEKTNGGFGIETELTRLGRNPRAYSGFVNTPIVRGSTVLFPDAETLETRDVEFTYGRPSNPTTRALETALAKLEGGARTFLTPSGLSAIAVTLLSFAEAGGHMLISDSVYMPTRRFAGRVLKRMGVDVEYYDPLIDVRHRQTAPAKYKARVHRIRPARRPSKSRTSRRFAAWRAARACPSPSTILGGRRFISAPSSMG